MNQPKTLCQQDQAARLHHWNPKTGTCSVCGQVKREDGKQGLCTKRSYKLRWRPLSGSIWDAREYQFAPVLGGWMPTGFSWVIKSRQQAAELVAEEFTHNYENPMSRNQQR